MILEGVNLAREEYEFSYIDGMGYHFMNPDTYEDITVSPEIVEPVKDYLMEGNIYILLSRMKRSFPVAPRRHHHGSGGSS